MPVDVTNRDVNDVKAAAMPSFEIRGHVRFDDDSGVAPFSSLKFLLQEREFYMLEVSLHFSPKADGTIQLSTRHFGNYALRMDSQGDAYIKSVSLGGHPLEGAQLNLDHGAAGEMEIVMGVGAGEIAGAIRWPEAVAEAPPVAATHAILVSADGVSGNTGARSVEIDPAGQFRFRFVPPGRWLVFVSPEYDEGLWQNAEFVKQIESRGVAVSLEKKGMAHADVAPLTSEDIETAVAKVWR